MPFPGFSSYRTPAVAITAAIPFATADIDARIAAGENLDRDHFIRLNAEAIACSAHLRGVSVAEYVGLVAPELVGEPKRRAA